MLKPVRDIRTIAVFAYPGANSLDVTGPLQVFSSADRYMKEFAPQEEKLPLEYRTEVIGLEAGPVTMSAGFDLHASRGVEELHDDIDTLLIAGGVGVDAVVQKQSVLDWLCRMQPRVRRFGSVCTGAFILAKAGLLDGKKATTHWRYCSNLHSIYPRVKVEPDAIYVQDGDVYTSGGVTAGIDLALALLEEDCGPKIALSTAKEIVACKVRPGGQSQYSTQIEPYSVRSSSLNNLLEWISANLDGDLSVDVLADYTAMSPRNFARVFVRELGVTPAKYVERTRVEAARIALEETDTSLAIIAKDYGFGHPETMRRVFLRCLKVGPQEYRRRFQITVNAPHSADS